MEGVGEKHIYESPKDIQNQSDEATPLTPPFTKREEVLKGVYLTNVTYITLS